MTFFSSSVEDQRLALHAHQHFVFGQFEVIHQHGLAVLPRRRQRRFVDHVGQVSAGESRCAAGQNGEIDIVRERNLAGMDPQNFFAAPNIRTVHNHPAVKTPRPQQRRIEHVRPVGRGHQDDAFVRLKAVHLDQQLIQSLLALVVSAAQACAAMASDRVDFVDEDDARSILLALLKQVANAARAHADEHLNEVRTGNREERNIGFTGHSPRQQSLAGSRRADQQYALGNASAQLLELLRLAQEFNNFLQLFFGLIDAGHILERDFLLLHGEQPRPALAERQRLISAGLHLADHEDTTKLPIKISGAHMVRTASASFRRCCHGR